jgi:site-specific DNA-methyltransferase (adenine-specific)
VRFASAPVDLDPRTLTPHPRNYRGHPPEQIEHLKASITEHGLYRNVVVARGDVILAGHGVVIATVELGVALVPVVRLDIDPDDPRALKLLAGDNEITRLADDDDGALAAILKELADSSVGLLGTGYDDAGLTEFLIRVGAYERHRPGEGDPDEVPEPPIEAVTTRGDAWALGEHLLVCGDSTEAVANVESGSVQLLATDPPYYRVLDEEWDDQWGADAAAFLKWIAALLSEFDRVMADRATVGVFCSPEMSAGVELEMRRVFAVFNHIVWRKPGPGRLGAMDKDSLRHFWPSSERLILGEKCRNPDGDLFRFRDHVNHAVARDVYADVREMLVEARDRAGLTNAQIDAALERTGMAGHYFGGSQWCLPTEGAWDTIAALAPEGVEMPTWAALRHEFDSRRREFDSRRHEFDSRRREFDSRRADDLELWGDVWTFEPPARADRVGHAAQKPVALMEHIVGTMSREGDTVLDPFGGSGSTLIACENLGRKARLIEIDPHYCDVICRRFQEFTGIVPVRADTGESVSFVPDLAE